MAAVVTALETTVNTSAIFGLFLEVIRFVTILTVICISVYCIRRAFIAASKGKADF